MSKEKIEINFGGFAKLILLALWSLLFVLNYISLKIFIVGGLIILFAGSIALLIIVMLMILLVLVVLLLAIILSPFLLIGFVVYWIYNKFFRKKSQAEKHLNDLNILSDGLEDFMYWWKK
jgi:ABC-type multidrug transport system fused ATPase/permease subunit